ncbi:MAG: hypothetical protein KDK63_04185 [Chlamydiia bacterium]|nr:hypothetical protein [Chlamydiia bacterium]
MDTADESFASYFMTEVEKTNFLVHRQFKKESKKNDQLFFFTSHLEKPEQRSSCVTTKMPFLENDKHRLWVDRGIDVLISVCVGVQIGADLRHIHDLVDNLFETSSMGQAMISSAESISNITLAILASILILPAMKLIYEYIQLLLNGKNPLGMMLIAPQLPLLLLSFCHAISSQTLLTSLIKSIPYRILGYYFWRKGEEKSLQFLSEKNSYTPFLKHSFKDLLSSMGACLLAVPSDWKHMLLLWITFYMTYENTLNALLLAANPARIHHDGTNASFQTKWDFHAINEKDGKITRVVPKDKGDFHYGYSSDGIFELVEVPNYGELSLIVVKERNTPKTNRLKSYLSSIDLSNDLKKIKHKDGSFAIPEVNFSYHMDVREIQTTSHIHIHSENSVCIYPLFGSTGSTTIYSREVRPHGEFGIVLVNKTTRKIEGMGIIHPTKSATHDEL